LYEKEKNNTSDSALNDLDSMYLFKESLMKNKKIMELDLKCRSSFSHHLGDRYNRETETITDKAIDVFLNHGNWTNKSLKILSIECKIGKFSNQQVRIQTSKELKW
jgi:hypothetical protein